MQIKFALKAFWQFTVIMDLELNMLSSQNKGDEI